jgi:hypothetical protein
LDKSDITEVKDLDDIYEADTKSRRAALDIIKMN